MGAVVPSSPFLVRKMLSKIDFTSVRLIVELGPGTGVVTREILKRLHPEGRVIAIESSEVFCEILRKISDPRLRIECASAERLVSILGGEKADVVVSGLPLASLRRSVVSHVLDAVRDSVSPNGLFVQFQYSRLSRNSIKKRFSAVSIEFVSLNVPPAFVYSATSPIH